MIPDERQTDRDQRYLAILEVCECVQLPCPLPVFDLSGKIFPQKKKSAEKEG